MIKNIVRFFLGTYHVSAVANTNNLINYVFINNIKIFNVKINANTISFDCYKKSFLKLSNYLDSACEYSVLLKGAPPYIKKYKYRAGILVGALLFFAFFYFVSMFVWKIDVIGCKTISKQEVLTRISECGLDIGSYKSNLIPKQIENTFLKGYSDVSWVSINIKGTVATVEIRENSRKVKKLDTSIPCNIHASRDGVIAKVVAYMGYSVVNVGDTVTAGDVLISGDYIDKYGQNYKLHSMGTVMANTTHKFSATVDYNSCEQVETGKTKRFYKLKIARFSIPLYFNKNILYNDYSLNKSNIYYEPFENFVLPFCIEKTTYTKTHSVNILKSKEVALQDAYEKVNEAACDLVGIKILDKQYKEKVYDDRVEVTLILSCYEDIGIKIKLN